jgi:RNA polymerase sigma-70 factor (ECF subfamily)
MPNRPEADDLMQEACIAMWRKFDTLKSEESFRSWAYSYLRLTALNMKRKQKRSPLVFTEELIEIISNDWKEMGSLSDAKSSALANCLKELPDKQRNLLAMYYSSEKITVRQMSEQLERPIDGIRKALTRIRAILKVCINDKLIAEGAINERI